MAGSRTGGSDEPTTPDPASLPQPTHQQLPSYNAAAGDDPASSASHPPPYLGSDAAPPPRIWGSEDETLQVPPATLLLNSTTIYSTSGANCPPVYKLTHAIEHLRDTNITVELSRFDHRVRPAAANNTNAELARPRVVTRAKPIFKLTCPPSITVPNFEYHLESVSRGNLGHVGMKTYRRFRSLGFQAYRATRPRPHAELEAQELLFEAKSRGGGRFDWRRRGGDGGDKRIVAYETGSQGMYQLQIVETLPRPMRDALVGAWCLRLWWWSLGID